MVSTTHIPFVHNGQLPIPAPGPTEAGSWDLVAAAQAGDRDAFGRLYARYVAQVQRVVTAKVRDRHLAEDLTSETFAQALRAINAVSDRGRDVGVWLHVIARNRVRDHAKSCRARYDAPVAEIPVTAAAGLSPEDVVVAREAAATVRCHVARLGTDQRQVLYHRFVEDRTVTQTATVMGRSAASVRALQYRAMANLRTALAADDRTGSAGQQATVDPLVRARAVVTAAGHRAIQYCAADRQARAQALHRARGQDGLAESDGAALGVAGGVA